MALTATGKDLVERARSGALDAVLIAGPTASGKSALAILLADLLGGVVVNADSMQVYADLRVLSARPSMAEEAQVPHRLFGFVPGGAEYSVGDYARDCAALLAGLHAEGRVPIIVGGTGLYFRALTEGLVATPEIPGPVRARIEAFAAAGGDLHAQLKARDPDAAARLNPADTPRLMRALEVVEATGQPLAMWQARAELLGERLAAAESRLLALAAPEPPPDGPTATETAGTAPEPSLHLSRRVEALLLAAFVLAMAGAAWLVLR